MHSPPENSQRHLTHMMQGLSAAGAGCVPSFGPTGYSSSNGSSAGGGCWPMPGTGGWPPLMQECSSGFNYEDHYLQMMCNNLLSMGAVAVPGGFAAPSQHLTAAPAAATTHANTFPATATATTNGVPGRLAEDTDGGADGSAAHRASMTPSSRAGTPTAGAASTFARSSVPPPPLNPALAFMGNPQHLLAAQQLLSSMAPAMSTAGLNALRPPLPLISAGNDGSVVNSGSDANASVGLSSLPTRTHAAAVPVSTSASTGSALSGQYAAGAGPLMSVPTQPSMATAVSSAGGLTAAPPSPVVVPPVTEGVQAKQALQQRNVYVSGLPESFRPSAFRSMCEVFGRITSSKLCMEGDNAERCKGYGFVLYQDVEAASTCIATLNGKVLQGKQLQVRRADLSAAPQPLDGLLNASVASLSCPPGSSISMTMDSGMQRGAPPLRMAVNSGPTTAAATATIVSGAAAAAGTGSVPVGPTSVMQSSPGVPRAMSSPTHATAAATSKCDSGPAAGGGIADGELSPQELARTVREQSLQLQAQALQLREQQRLIEQLMRTQQMQQRAMATGVASPFVAMPSQQLRPPQSSATTTTAAPSMSQGPQFTLTSGVMNWVQTPQTSAASNAGAGANASRRLADEEAATAADAANAVSSV